MVNEIEALKTCHHPNIIRIFDDNLDEIINNPDGTSPLYSVLELGVGELFDFVAESGAFKEETARFYVRQLIDGLNHAHKKGFTHRDIKPENLLLDKRFTLKIADWGF